MYLHNTGVTRIKKTKTGIVVHNTHSNKNFRINEDLLRVFKAARGNLTYEKALYESTGSIELNPIFENTIQDFISKGVFGLSPMPKEESVIFREDMSEYPLDMVYFEPTGKCNLTCIHCFAQNSDMKEKMPEMIKEEAFATISSIDKKGVMEVCLTGGEIMCHPNALEIMSEIKSKGIKFGILTNGMSFNDEKIQRLAGLKPSFIAVSLDSHKEEVHNYIRNGNAFSLTTRNIKAMVEAKLTPRVNYTLFAGLNDSSKDIKDYLEFVSSLGIKKGKITFDEFCPEGRGSTLSDFLVDEKITIRKIKEAYNDVFGVDLDDIKSMMPEGSFCGVGIDVCCIKPSGRITPCPALYGGRYDLGHMSELDNVWKDSEMLNFLRRKEYLEKGKCGTCESLESCLGGCRAKAMTFNGSLDSHDPWMCAYCGEDDKNYI